MMVRVRDTAEGFALGIVCLIAGALVGMLL